MPRYSSGSGARIGVLMAYWSLAQAPKSINLQRSLQNGRHGLAGANSLRVWQVGQGTCFTVTVDYRLQ